MKNIKEIKTTIIGAVLFILGVVYFAFPYFSEKELWDVNNLYLAVLIIGGILLLLAPDKILEITFGFLKKKSDK